MRRFVLLCLAALTALFAPLSVRSAPTDQTAPGLPPGFRADLYVNGLSHPTAMAFGPDLRLYVAEQDGTILAIGNHRVVRVASGFDTPLGIAWNRGLLFISSLGKVSSLRPDRSYSHFVRRDIITGLPTGRHQNDGMAFSRGWLNKIVQGGDYGWPDCWGRGGGSHCGETVAPAALLPTHCSADGLTFYSGGTFPAAYRGDAFVAEYGATVGAVPTGHVVQRIQFGPRGANVTNFATGLDHPLAVTGARDGSLLIADWGTGIIWHVQYAG